MCVGRYRMVVQQRRDESAEMGGRGVFSPCGPDLNHCPWTLLVSLDGHPGDRVNLSCVGVSHPIRWAWAPSFPACKGLSKGRRPILWASSSGTPTVSPVQPFAGRLRALDPGIRRLELLLSAGDSGTFICRGRHENESRTVLHVLGDGANCRAPGPSQGRSKPSSTGGLNSDTHSGQGGGLGGRFLSGRGRRLSPHLTSAPPPLHRSPRVRVSPVPDPIAGFWATAGTWGVGRGLLAAQVSARGVTRGGRGRTRSFANTS